MTAESERNGVGQEERQWLVRSTENRISGPFGLEQVRAMIEQGKLRLGDEVCHANTYWFYLHEAEEVRSQLGIEIPQQLYAKKAEEITETQTDTANLERTDPEVVAARMASSTGPLPGSSMAGSLLGPAGGSAQRPASRGSGGEAEPPELESSFDDIGENTAVMSNRAFRDYRNKKRPQSKAASQPRKQQSPHPHSHGSTHAGPAAQPAPAEARPAGRLFERSKAFQLLAYLMMIGAVALVIAIIKLLQQQPG